MNLNIAKEHKQILRQTLNNRMREIEDELSGLPLFKELQVIRATIQELQETSGTSDTPEIFSPSIIDNARIYNPKWSSLKKGQFVLQMSGQNEMTTKEMVNAIMKIEPHQKRATLVSNLSAALGNSYRENKLFTRRENDLGEFVYALKE